MSKAPSISSITRKKKEFRVIVHTCNFFSWEAEAGGICVQNKPRQHCETVSTISKQPVPFITLLQIVVECLINQSARDNSGMGETCHAVISEPQKQVELARPGYCDVSSTYWDRGVPVFALSRLSLTVLVGCDLLGESLSVMVDLVHIFKMAKIGIFLKREFKTILVSFSSLFFSSSFFSFYRALFTDKVHENFFRLWKEAYYREKGDQLMHLAFCLPNPFLRRLCRVSFGKFK